MQKIAYRAAMEPQLTIQLVGWNSADDLQRHLSALQQVPTDQAIIRYIDNHSTDNSVAVVRAALPHADIVELPTNQGFGGGHNEGLTRCTTPFVLILNPDVHLNWPGIAQLLLYLQTHETVGALQGKLTRPGSPTLIDSAGITLTWAFNGRERGAGEPDTNQYAHAAPLSATTGAASLFRLTALHAVVHAPGEFYDRDFFAYKEDVDLGWRLRRAGWEVQYEPQLMGTHERNLKRTGPLGWGLHLTTIYQRLQNPRTRSSIRNWCWLIIKNASIGQYLIHSPFIKLRLLTLILLSLLYPPLVTVWPEILRGLPRMVAKRQQKG